MTTWWKSIWSAALGKALPEQESPTRWVVLDCESSGLNPQKDKLLSIFALSLSLNEAGQLSIDYGQTLDVVLNHNLDGKVRSPAASSIKQSVKDNVLIHGIGLGMQHLGATPQSAMQAFCTFVGSSPILAFHAGFDRVLLTKAARQYLGKRLENDWLDIEHIVAVLHQEHKRLALDDWLQRYRIGCTLRHNACADTLATAELMLAIWAKLQKKNIASWTSLCEFAKSVRHLAGRS